MSPPEQQRWGEGRPADQLQGKIRAASAETLRQRALAGGSPNQPSSCSSSFQTQFWTLRGFPLQPWQTLLFRRRLFLKECYSMLKSRSKNAVGGRLKTGSPSSGLKTGSSLAAAAVGTRAGRRWKQQVVDTKPRAVVFQRASRQTNKNAKSKQPNKCTR